ncbi:hypothetical protein [Aquamicrobium sp. LC103]|uniref:hypothetical protein n=1 Tax=Aquamicrobium sp. LC103 TaxID=1120658 RepID=UPI00063E9DEF|nr:hypothetical protein [Aquamicrobium sp. LC103]TKT81406.1 hypothetical protein XW59_005975 [Aquamicrobium sp. LC103]
MNSVLGQSKLLAACGLMAALPLQAAQAQNVDGALDRLKELTVGQGIVLDWQDARISGSDVELVGVTAKAGEETAVVGDVQLKGIGEIDQGYRIAEITLPQYKFGGDEGSLALDGISMTDVILPNEAEIDRFGGFLFYKTADMAKAAFTIDGTDIFTMDDLRVEVTEPVGDGPMSFIGNARNFNVDLSIVDDPNSKAVIEALGYQTLTGDFQMAGSWRASDGRMELSQYDVTVNDAGTLGLSFDLGGYTTDFVKSLRELQQQMAESPEGEDNSAQGLAMLGLLQQLNFHRAEITFADDSLTGKLLDYAAKQQGTTPSNVANQAKAVLPFVMAQLNNPDLTKMVASAVSTFLDDPKSLRVTAAPEEPVPFALIMAGAMSAPQELTKTLGVNVTAND